MLVCLSVCLSVLSVLSCPVCPVPSGLLESDWSRWHKKRVDGTKSESVEQNQSRPGIFKESVPYHPVGTAQPSWFCTILFGLARARLKLSQSDH